VPTGSESRGLGETGLDLGVLLAVSVVVTAGLTLGF
jgi:hypothetical protein